MPIRISKPPVNIREKLAELERPIGLNGSALMRTETPQEAFSLIGAGRKNRIINGDMQIDQRSNGSLVSSANGFIVDRWTGNWYAPAGGSYSGQQVSDAPSGFRNSLRITVTSTPSNNNDSYFQIFQIIEGYNIADLMMGTANAKSFTCSFWVKCSVAGTYSICFFNNQQTVRLYVTTYNINSANTWEYKTVTVPGDTSPTGTWGSTNGQGLGVFFDMGSGTNQEASANSWVTSNTRRISGTVRLINTNGATWQVTGVQLEIGKVATPFEYLNYGDELAMCQRYFEVVFAPTAYNNTCLIGRANTTSQAIFAFPWKVEKRATPTTAVTGTGILYYAGVLATSSYGFGNFDNGTVGGRFTIDSITGSPLIAGDAVHFDVNSVPPFIFTVSAEL
jgi:hypothetical protein